MTTTPTASAVDVIAEGCAEGQFWPGVWQQMAEPEREQFRRMAEGALRRAHAAGLSVVPREQVEWQDISTAPRDAVIIICAVGSPSNLAFAGRQIVHPAYIDEDDRICEVGTCKPEIGIVAGAWIATHWRPLPAAPSAPPSERAGGDEHG